VHEYLVGPGTEPSTAADPLHPGVVAVVSENIVGRCSRPAVHVSQDGGGTWGPARYPWVGCQDIHAVIAWGPTGLWAVDAVGVAGGVSLSVTHSEDLGKHWSTPYIERRTPPWVGCYPAVAVDDDPASLTYGAIYVAYNSPGPKGPAIVVIASVDRGRHWSMAKVPAMPTVNGYPEYNRIGYRVAPVRSTGGVSAWLSFYQADMKAFIPPTTVVTEGASSNVGRRRIGVVPLSLSGAGIGVGPLSAPISSTGLDMWQTSLAADGDGQPWVAGAANGLIFLAHLSGGTWSTRTFRVRGKSSIKPSIAVNGDVVFVGWHAASNGRYWTYYSISYDRGVTFLPTALITSASWRLPTNLNNVGLRENAVFWTPAAAAQTQAPVIYYGYGDNRAGTRIYVARIQP
jgi:hypothetical protein